MAAKLQPIRGTHDIYGDDFYRYSKLISQAEKIVTSYGYQGIMTPIFESTAVFQKTLGESSDIVGKEMYTFSDRGGDSLTLRPEGTAPAVRASISLGLTQNLPLKLYYHGPMFRYERPQSGRTRQFFQFGVECIGVDHPSLDAETIMMAFHLFQELGIQDKVKLHINSLGDLESRSLYKSDLVNYFSAFKDDLSVDSQRRLLSNPLRILDSKDENDQKIAYNAPLLNDYLTKESTDFYNHVKKTLDDFSCPYVENFRLVRGLDYYNHTIFEFVPSTGGTVLAGGRYNGLMKAMGGPNLGGIGWAFGVFRLNMLCSEKGINPKYFSVIPMDDKLFDEAFKITQMLRKIGKDVDFIFSGNAAKRLKKADRDNIHFAILLGEDEWNRNNIIVKDLKTGEQKEISVSSLESFVLSIT